MKILYFDVAAIIIQVILFSSLIFRKMTSGRANRIFALLLAQTFVSTIFDCWSEAYGTWIPASESNLCVREVLCYGYFLFRNMTPFFYQFFCVQLQIRGIF